MRFGFAAGAAVVVEVVAAAVCAEAGAAVAKPAATMAAAIAIDILFLKLDKISSRETVLTSYLGRRVGLPLHLSTTQRVHPIEWEL